MKQFKKKTYNQPQLTEVLLDKVITLETTSEAPPDQGGLPWETSGSSTSTADSTEEPLEKNNFEENPFQR
ncbi:hypothetical protein [Marinilabilia salmonicolor]|uniref:Uncharacterized protein n=1 Tax=Marinilabilia salmonicolor TaxID=989 RepID=A0A368UK94_9BACT|nr:hypothetical protein [Marinilabilia salmonicolor]RCW29117.1 hypothetical protein DFO77_13118 [Marinilabilia salmonicolor]